MHFLSELFDTALAEDVVFVFRQLFRSEPCHVFHQSKNRHVHLFVAVHVNALACVGQCHLLRSGNDDGASDGQVLQQGEVDVARSRRRVKYKVVQFAPVAISDELLEGV